MNSDCAVVTQPATIQQYMRLQLWSRQASRQDDGEIVEHVSARVLAWPNREDRDVGDRQESFLQVCAAGGGVDNDEVVSARQVGLSEQRKQR
jgi:hypothetical protein